MKMKKATKQAAEGVAIEVMHVSRGRLTFYVRGATPLIYNCVSEKAKRELLYPAPEDEKRAKRKVELKHDPIVEYRASVYATWDNKAPTRLVIPSVMFKSGLASVATDMPGAARAVVGRLTSVEGPYIPVYGVPQMLMSVTRNSNMERTPDIRTRAILPTWACIVTVNFAQPHFKVASISDLMAAAGFLRGIGDFRVEKGKGDFGQFKLVNERDAEWKAIVKNGGRVAQDAALEDPQMYDGETAKLYAWFEEERTRRHEEKGKHMNGGNMVAVPQPDEEQADA